MRVVSGSQYCSVSGMCATEGAGNHGNNERCTIEVLTGGTLSSTEFYTEPCCEVTRCHRPPSPPFTPPPPAPHPSQLWAGRHAKSCRQSAIADLSRPLAEIKPNRGRSTMLTTPFFSFCDL